MNNYLMITNNYLLKGGLGINNYLIITNKYLLRAVSESSQPQSSCLERWPAVGSLPSLPPSLALEVDRCFFVFVFVFISVFVVVAVTVVVFVFTLALPAAFIVADFPAVFF